MDHYLEEENKMENIINWIQSKFPKANRTPVADDTGKLKRGWLPDNMSFDYIDLDPQSTNPEHKEGRLFFNADKSVLNIYNDSTDERIILDVGEELRVKVKNDSGTNITNGQVLYPTGAIGDNPKADLAKADAYSTCRPIGVATQDINKNEIGFVTIFGRVRYLDTSSYNEGDTLYVSPSTAGNWTSTKPSYPNIATRIGFVIRKHATEGMIMVDSDPERDIYTSGSILFANGNGEIAENNSDLFWDDTNKELEINGRVLANAGVNKATISTPITDVTANEWVDIDGFSPISDETSYNDLDFDSDFGTVNVNRTGIYIIGGCIHVQNNTAGTITVTLLIRVLINKGQSNETEVVQRGITVKMDAGSQEHVNASEPVYLVEGETINMQYWTDNADIEFDNNTAFDSNVAIELWSTYLGNKN